MKNQFQKLQQLQLQSPLKQLLLVLLPLLLWRLHCSIPNGAALLGHSFEPLLLFDSQLVGFLSEHMMWTVSEQSFPSHTTHYQPYKQMDELKMLDLWSPAPALKSTVDHEPPLPVPGVTAFPCLSPWTWLKPHRKPLSITSGTGIWVIVWFLLVWP